MRIIIVGAGKVGYTLAANLVNESHDVIVIDRRDDVIAKVSDTLDVLAVRGNGASISTLKQVRVDRADVVIAATNRDELNMVCCFAAKKLGAGFTIARVRDHDYAGDIDLFRRELDLDLCINPEYTTAVEISRLLRFPDAVDIDSFYRGRIEMVGFLVKQGDFFAGEPLHAVTKKLKNTSVLFCAVEREGQVIVPDGNTVLQPGDKAHVIGKILDINRFFKQLGRITPKIRDVVIIGGSRISWYLSEVTLDMNIGVKIIESDYKRCVELSEALPSALIVSGDGTDHELLASESLANADAFIALTGRDEDNLITSLYAAQLGVPKVITKIDRQNYYGIAKGLESCSVVNPKTITAYSILRTVRGMQSSQGSRMTALYPIANGGAEALEFEITGGMKGLNTPLKDLTLRHGILIAAIARENEIIIPEGGDHIEAGDHVIVISHSGNIGDIHDIFAG